MSHSAALALPLCVVLGAFAGAGAVTLLRPLSKTGGGATPSLSAPPAAWNWRAASLPPSLAPDAAGAAISAWRALRAADGSALPYPVRADALRALLARLDSRARPRLLAIFNPKPEGDDARLRNLAFGVWIETDPGAALLWAYNQGEPAANLTYTALQAWSACEAASAAAWACGLPSSPQNHQLASFALQTLAQDDLARAQALLAGRDPEFRNAVMPAIFVQLAKSDPAAAVRAHAAFAWKNGEGFYQMRETLAAWAKQNPRAALAWLSAQPAQHRGQLGNWIGSLTGNPEEIRALGSIVAAQPDFPQRAETLADMLFSWGTDKPAEALTWLDSLNDPELRADVLGRLGNRHYSDHPEKSLPLALAQPSGANRNKTIGRLLTSWAKINPSATLDWIGQQSDPGVRAASLQVQGVLLADIARDEPETALAEWAALTDPRARQAAIDPIVEAWGKKDPGAALRWSQEQFAAATDAKTPNRSFSPKQELVFAWARKDPAAAIAWAEQLALGQPNEPHSHYVVERLMEGLAGTWENRAPRSETADLYARIRDQKLRTRTLEKHLREWLTHDQTGARAWLDTSTALSAEQAAKLISGTK